jgi:thiamine biosynthesis lipoprotein
MRGAVDAVLGPAEEPDSGQGTPRGPALDLAQDTDYLLTVSRRAMACNFEVHLPAATRGAGTEAALAALDLVDDLEAQMTVYRETSDVLEINRLAAFRPVEVEERLFDLLQRAIRISQETGGAFDVTSNPLSEVWGFSRRQGRLTTEVELDSAKRRVGFEQIVLEPDARRISFSREGVAINLNSIGKGYALDRAGELLVGAGMDHFLLHGGNSSVLARVAGDGGQPWRIGVRNPVRPTERLGEIAISNRAVGTSGSGTQYFHHGGRRYGHILDPRTGNPAEGVLSATVLAPSGAEADALATAFYVMGPEDAEEYCRRHADLSAISVCPAQRGANLEPLVFGDSDTGWRPK